MGATMDALRERRNAAGGHTAKLDDYVFPQRHDSRLIRALSPDRDEAWRLWRALPQIDNARIRDIELGNFASGQRPERLLRGVFDGIRSDGADSAKPSANFGGSMATRRRG